VHRFSWQRAIGAVVCLALLPVATRVPALLALTLLAVVVASIVAYEYFRFGELRARLRAQLH
jgi:uncharacterized membrane protein